MNYIDVNIALELYSIIVTCLLLVYLLLTQDRKDRLNRLFFWMLVLNACVLFSDLLTWTVDARSSAAMLTLVRVANFCVYSFGYAILAVFAHYQASFISARIPVPKRAVGIITGLCAVAIVLVVISQFNNMYYYFDAQGEYHRGGWYWLSQFFPILIILDNALMVLYYRKKLNRCDVFALLSYEFLPVVAMAIQIFFYGVTLLYISTTISMLIIYISIQMEQRHQLRQKELELTNSRINIMLSQIQPHFLYNALTAICQLCDEDPKQAKQATMEFSFFLRSNMDSLTQMRPIAFDKELEHVRNYLSLEQKRFGDKLRVEYCIETPDFRLPALTLQPIVENAVRYGVTKRECGGTVTIRTEQTQTHFRVIVSDDGVGFDVNRPYTDGRSHIGIENVRNRLFSMCAGVLEIESTPGAGTVATISIPKEFEI